MTAINPETSRLLGKPRLYQPTKVLYGSSHPALKVLGQTTVFMRYKGCSARLKIYVVEGLKKNLLGLPAITQLQLVCRVDSTELSGHPIAQQFPTVFKGLGTIGNEYTIKLKEKSVPYSLYVPRNVPIPLRPKVKEELERMEKLGVISKVQIPTQWCCGMVVVPKKSGAVRICVDLKPLNESVLREPHPIPKVDDTLGLLAGATCFSKLDADSGFWQIPLSEQSRPLTTFITPFGRYQFNQLPFGISCAPELFQQRMNQILEGLEGFVCLMDDVLVFGTDQEEHDRHLKAVLQRLERAGATLNRDKCEFSIKFLGHVIDQEGIRADPDKVVAITKMCTPQNLSDLRRFMGLVNQLEKFSSKIADIGQPLMSTKRAWVWGPAQDKSFMDVKEELSKPSVLALYDPNAETNVSADASSFGLGAVLLQSKNSTWKPFAYASRSVSDAEKRYAQIEKEALATTWGCEKFSTYLIGKSFKIETDHKPLVPLLNTKHLDDLPPRILRFRLRLAKYSYIAKHIPGKLLYAVDALSRFPVGTQEDKELQDKVQAYVNHITVPSLPASIQVLEKYRKA